MISADLLRRSVFQAAGLLRSRLPGPICRFKTQVDLSDPWQQETWGLRAFRGIVPKWVPFARTDFTGRFIFLFLTLELPASGLETLVNGYGLTLESTGTPTHPVFLLLGQQQGVRQILWPDGISMNYLESIIAIPKVRLRGCTDGYCGPFNFATRIDANELSPVLLGLVIGYPKHVSWINAPNNQFEVMQVGTRSKILTAQFNPRGERFRVRDILDRHEAFSMLRDPVFSRSLVSPQIFTFMDWQMEEAWARAQWVTASVTVHKDLPGLPANTYQWGGQSNALAVRLSVPWQLAGPFDRMIIQPPKSTPVAGGEAPRSDYQRQ